MRCYMSSQAEQRRKLTWDYKVVFSLEVQFHCRMNPNQHIVRRKTTIKEIIVLA